jgi:hypothetical protein
MFNVTFSHWKSQLKHLNCVFKVKDDWDPQRLQSSAQSSQAEHVVRFSVAFKAIIYSWEYAIIVILLQALLDALVEEAYPDQTCFCVTPITGQKYLFINRESLLLQ